MVNGLIFVTLCGYFFISSSYDTIVTRIENIFYLCYCWDLLLFICFLSSQENLYMIEHDSNFITFYDIYNTVNKLNQRQIHYLSLTPNCFGIFF